MKWHYFSEVVTDATSKFTKIKATDYRAQGRYKIIDQGKEAIAGYTDDVSLVNRQLLPIVIFGDHTRALKYVEEPIALGADGAKALRVNPDLANARYVYYYLRSIQIKEAGYSRHFKFLKEVKIPIPFKDGAPDFDYQIRIAQLLGKVEGLIAQRKQQLQQLDDLLKSVFLEMFGDPVRNEKGWDTGSLSTYGSFKNGLNFGKGESGTRVRYLGVGDFKSKAILDDFDSLAFIELNELPAADYFLQDGDLLFVRSNGNRELVGRCMAVYPGAEKVTYSGFCIRYRINDPALQATYVAHLFRSAAFRRVLFQGGQGANIQNINQQILSSLPIPVPAEGVQDQFAVIVDKIEGLKSRYKQSLTDLEVLYGALSQQAFKGELDLSRVPMPDMQAEEEKNVATDPLQAPAEQGLAIHLPEISVLLNAVQGPVRQQEILRFWLEAYCGQLGNIPFSGQKFLVAAQAQLAALYPDDVIALTADAYEHIKNWVFEKIGARKLKQTRDIICVDGRRQFGNKILLRVRKGSQQ